MKRQINREGICPKCLGICELSQIKSIIDDTSGRIGLYYACDNCNITFTEEYLYRATGIPIKMGG